MKYDPARIPAGIAPSSLTLAYYDTATGAWETLTNIYVDEINHVISGKTTHFTQFAVLSSIPSAAPPATTPSSTTVPSVSNPPATNILTPKMSLNRTALNVGALTLSLSEVSSGDKVEISALVQNPAGDNGVGVVTLTINGAVESTKDMNIAMGKSENVSFTVTKNTPGKYLVDVNGQTSFFNVKGNANQPSEGNSGWWPLPLYVWIIGGGVLLLLIAFLGFRWWRRRNSYY